MKKVLKILVGLLVLAGIGYGVYTILPEYPHNFVKGFVQPMTNVRAKDLIHGIQNLQNKDMGGVSYKEILEKNTGSWAWVYEMRETDPAAEYVVFYGRGACINLKDYSDYNGMLNTSALVKVEFRVAGKNVEIIPYIDGVKMLIDDKNHVEQNKAIRKEILYQLYNGMREG